MKAISLSPVTRISGLLSIDLYLGPAQTIREANCIGEQFRGFELMMKGRKILDAVYFTQRICGICSMAHGYTAARLVNKIYNAKLAPEARMLQQAMLGAEFLQNHIRHFYLLALPDYLESSSLPGSGTGLKDRRFTTAQTKLLVDHYFAAMEYSRKCHEMLAVFGGKIPHQHGLVAQGVTVAPTADKKMQFLSLLKQVQDFLTQVMVPDAYLLAEVYPDYFHIGTRPPRFISFGLFEPEFGGHFPAGIYDGEKFLPVQPQEIEESILFSWYTTTPEGETVPAPDKPAAYTWVKAPRYRGLALEGGPLARKIISSRSQVTVPGTMSRIIARAEEAALIAAWMEPWVRELPAKGKYITELAAPARLQATQINDAPRGPLLHSVKINNDQVEKYDVITPSTWNFSPKDDTGQRGPVEEALVGTRVSSTADLVEVGRVVRAFDPCLSCAAHVINSEGQRLISINLQG
ncbi:nickel-dependent hydrogenase large subunit [Neomoorella thermoacetica]|uniref:nickel-dependent hydrogenase large subunit n=1 Tax=Neomoorella thermoacetica TaxID=1525 RepID=UPI0008FA8DB6|nr:nickel-dependent hydrogenase large subunit [Moorella thermoacetica]OIQ12659.1 periplasmic [NiFeSe] hydrogenase large subunit [Moorella thermoacetica]